MVGPISPSAPAPGHTPRSWLRPASGRRIAVLGAQGFIGSHVVRAALAAGSEGVQAVCTGEPWRLGDLDDRRLAISRLPGDHWWRQRDQPQLAELVDGAHAMVVLGYRPPEHRSGVPAVEHELTTNALGALRVATTAAGLGQRLVFASSADVYGHRPPHPVDESERPRPATAYAVAKLAAEHLVASAADQCISLRIATVFGPGENGPRAIPSFIRAVLAGRAPVVHGAGDDVRDYIHVGDVAAAVVNACIGNEVEPGTVLNVGSGVGRTTLEVLAAVTAAMATGPVDPEHRPRDGAPCRLVLDNRAARTVLGLDPDPDFARLLAAEAKWLQRSCTTR